MVNNGGEVLKINDKEIKKDLVSVKAQKDYDKFAEDMKDKTNDKNTKEVTDAFNDH